MVDRQHVARAEAAAEKVDDEGQHCPPGRGAAEESGDDEHGAEEASHAFVRDVAARNLEYREEGEDVGDHHDEIGDRQPEDRGEVLPQRRLARPVAAYLRYGVLGEDVDADDYHEDAAYHAQQGVVLLDLGLEHRVKKQRRHGHEGVGTGYAQAGDDSRTTAFRQGALDAQHGHGAYRDRCRHAYADAAEHNVQDFQSHFLRLRSFRQQRYEKPRTSVKAA